MRMQQDLITLAILLTTPALASAQAEPAPSLPKGDATVAGQAVAGKPFSDLTNRYRFIEHYTTREEQVRPGLVGQYQVAIQEVLKDTVETPDGPSKPSEITRQTIFIERPAEVTGLGAVGATIRSYQQFQVRPDTVGPRPLVGLTIWYRPEVNELPQVLSLTEDHRLTDREYEIAGRQVFMPNLTALLPPHPVRVGDTWRVPRKAVRAMLGETDLRSDSLAGKFIGLRRDDDGKTFYAVLSVIGRVANPLAESTINSQILFAFATPAPDRPGDPPGLTGTSRLTRPDEPLVEASGAIIELRLARVASGNLPGGSSKNQRSRAVQELVLQRKLGAEGTAGPLKIFDAPAATEVNSWLTYSDSRNRFFFHHPQDLLPPERYQFSTKPGAEAIYLGKSRPDGRDLVRIDVFAKEQTPEALKDLLNNQWKQMKLEILPGNEEWLPEADWPHMKVFRIEAALKLSSRSARGSRLHYDAYLVKISKDASLMVVATTNREAVLAFRHDVEQMIKTFRLGSVGTP